MPGAVLFIMLCHLWI